MAKKVYVAMSGGVDSSVAAALLKEQGYSVVGVFMKFWSPPSVQATNSKTSPDYCLWKEERADAARVAARLGIPFLTWDFTQEYEKKVVNYMLEAYKSGITPNPDIMCNKEIKFGLFFEKAIAEGADFAATGHYARIRTTNEQRTSQQLTTNSQNISYLASSEIEEGSISRLSLGRSLFIRELLQALDLNKDQSYFLYTLEQRHLERTLFPIGGYTKPEVRELAKKFGLSVADKKDSQGVCFIGPLKMKSFLKDYIKPKKGWVILINSKSQTRNPKQIAENPNFEIRASNFPQGLILGEHDGAYYYTIGQRHGIDLKLAGGPYYVIGKDVNKNEVYVGKEEDLHLDECQIINIHWISEVPKLPAKIGVKIRYRSETVPASLSVPRSTFYALRFDRTIRALTPGQAAVFYDGEKVLGGGIIASV